MLNKTKKIKAVLILISALNLNANFIDLNDTDLIIEEKKYAKKCFDGISEIQKVDKKENETLFYEKINYYQKDCHKHIKISREMKKRNLKISKRGD